MLIELESAYGDKLIHGKHLTKCELQCAMNEILKIIDERDFLPVFCARYGYEELQYNNTIRVDYVIDLDTHLLIESKYE